MKKLIGFVILICVLIGIGILGFSYKTSTIPHAYYKVYLNGEVLGIINSKKDLENYIDKQNNKYKKQFKVDKIYAPNGLEIKKIDTYDNTLASIEDIYSMINEKEPFTVRGYQFILKREKEEDNIIIYTTSEKIFNDAVENTIKTFVGKENYDLYKNDTQKPISDIGSIIENIYVSDDITSKKVYIPVTEKIYTSSADLSKFFVFGESIDQKNYVVQIGDTIDSVAFANKISVEEFLISNPSFSSSKNLLFPSQVVTIGVTNPQLSVVMEQYSISDQEVNYSIEEQHDSSKIVGDDEVIQNGENGLVRVTQRVKYVNGAINYVDPINKEELKPTINEIVIKGDKYIPTVGSTRNWLWPTNSGYTISSDYIYRINPITGGRELHAAIDIAGTGYGSPIYAVTNGVVSESTYRYQDGNYVCINHNNGYYTCYAHMSRQNVKEGQTVERGQVIGYVGQSGWATGPHVHFEVWIGRPWYGGYRINPWSMY